MKPTTAEQWLTPKQLGAYFGLKVDSAYSWLADGLVPRRFVSRQGGRIRIHPDVVAILERVFKNSRGRTR